MFVGRVVGADLPRRHFCRTAGTGGCVIGIRERCLVLLRVLAAFVFCLACGPLRKRQFLDTMCNGTSKTLLLWMACTIWGVYHCALAFEFVVGTIVLLIRIVPCARRGVTAAGQAAMLVCMLSRSVRWPMRCSCSILLRSWSWGLDPRVQGVGIRGNRWERALRRAPHASRHCSKQADETREC